MAKQPKIPVLHIFHNRDGLAYKATIREDKAYLKGEKVAKFENQGVFTVKGIKLSKRSKTKFLIYLDGKSETAHMKIKKKPTGREKATENFQLIPTTEELFEPLTDEDRKTVVKREIAKQLGKFKAMETWQFIVIIAMLGASIALRFI